MGIDEMIRILDFAEVRHRVVVDQVEQRRAMRVLSQRLSPDTKRGNQTFEHVEFRGDQFAATLGSQHEARGGEVFGQLASAFPNSAGERDVRHVGVLPDGRHFLGQARPGKIGPAFFVDGFPATAENRPAFACFLDWFGDSYETQVVSNDGEYPLLGTMLLEGHRLIIDYAEKTVELS
jgi:hypothetical protein